MSILTWRCVLYSLFLCANLLNRAYTQPDVSQVAVSATLLKNHLFSLASDSLQGRQTGTIGQLKAALYCTQAFRQSHLSTVFPLDSIRGTFRQTFAFRAVKVAGFGGYSYNQHELSPLPLTARDSSKVLVGHNVAGLLIGTDLKQEVVVVSAHYDHLGHSGKRIYYGADDNASGTSTILSLSSVFDSLAQRGIRSRRSILFVLFAGEEEGLIGSKHFAYNSPIPMAQIVGNINVDMIGRVDDAHQKKPDYCYVFSSKQNNKLLKAAEIANLQSVNLALNQGGYDVENDPHHYFSRSDHVNFALFGTPILFFTNGEHTDYHKPSDTADKINYEVLRKRATLVFQTIWAVANESI